MPVLFGIAFVIVAKSVAVVRDRVTIVAPEITGSMLPNPDSIASGRLEPKSEEAFVREAYDMLLVNGLAPKNKSAENIRRVAFLKLGMADMKGHSRSTYMAAPPCNSRLVLFVSDSTEPVRRLFYFGGESGVLLQYLAGYSLDLETI